MTPLRNWFQASILLLAWLLCFQAQTAGQSRQQRAEEVDDYYRQWLDTDVLYIISAKEKEVFDNLSTSEEKDHFIEQFWFRRDLDPRTALNEFKEEHYRRIAYANEKYHSGIEGWRTDRGMIYILFGPPDGLEKHPEGGTYQRKFEEGGGQTYTYPFEVWFYRHLEGVGPGIEIEFVDASRTNEYLIAMDPEQKDALFNIPGAGLTLAEKLGTMSRIDRIRTRWLGNPEGYRRFDTAGRTMRYRDYPLQRLETLYRLQRGPAVKYKDLEQIVTTRLSYSELPVRVRVDVMRYSQDRSLVPVTVFLEDKDLHFAPEKEAQDRLAARVGIYGEVQTLSGRRIYTFEDDIERRVAVGTLTKGLQTEAVYQKRFPLEPGRYKLSLVIQDQGSGKIATSDELVVVSPPRQDELETSSVVLTPRLDSPGSDETVGNPFVLGKYRVVPASDNRFRPGEQSAQAYFEVYNLALDQTTLEPSSRVEIALLHEGESVFPFTEVKRPMDFDGDRLLVYATIPFQGLVQGQYTLQFKVSDQIRQQSLRRDVNFVIE